MMSNVFWWEDYTKGGHIYEKIIVLKAVSIAKLHLLKHNKILKCPPFPLLLLLLLFFACQTFFERLDPPPPPPPGENS